MKMPDIAGDVWLNSEPLGRDDLRGKLVIADFWTYSCINCLRTLPHLKSWWSKYRDKEFLLIGIHAPEFEFEKERENVRRAMDENGVDWPVVLDNRFVNWHNFANHHWPAKYMADPDGKIVYEHFGEGDYEESEAKIRELLSRDPGNLPLPEPDPPEPASQCFSATHETYCGYVRGNLENKHGHRRDEEAEYEAPGSLRQDSIALKGRFLARGQYVQTAAPGSSLLLKFRATEVNLVMATADGSKARAEVLLDGNGPGDEEMGTDLDDDGTVTVSEPRMYNLIKADREIDAMLEVTSIDGACRAYAFTFSGCLGVRARSTSVH
jgi:thiol-disulfide isomerase/thioredoxin